MIFDSKKLAVYGVQLLLLSIITIPAFAVTLKEINQTQLRFRQTTDGFCDLHYTLNSGTQLNYTMTAISANECEFIVSDLTQGDRLRYFTTYQQGGLAYDTPWQEYVFKEDPPSGSAEVVEEISGTELLIRQATQGFCDIHFRINNGGQQNFAMNRNSGADGVCTFVIADLIAGDQIDFFTTYQIHGLAYDSEWQRHIFGGGQSSNEQLPYLGGAAIIPGNIEAENYDIGGEGLAYYDTSAGNTYSQYRGDDVDIRSVGTGFAVEMLSAQEWTEYSIEVTDRRDYEIQVHSATASPSTIRALISGATALDLDLRVEPFGAQIFRASEKKTIALNAGKHVLRLENNGSTILLDYISISAINSPQATNTPIPTASPEPTPILPGLPDAYPGYTGNYQNYELVVDDRFDSLDQNYWSTGDGGFTENDCRFQSQGVQFANGVMALVVAHEQVPASWSFDQNRWIGAKNYSCGELRSKESLLYGRFEARIRNPGPGVASGYISSLFTYVNDVEGAFKWREIDVEMEGARPTKFQANLIFGENTWQWYETRNWGAYEEKIEIGPTDQWKVYAIEWTPNLIRWYVDGVLLKTLLPRDVDGNPLRPPQLYPANIPQISQQVMMNFWIPNDLVQNNFGGNKRNNIYPMKAEYDWFRYYRYQPY